MRLIVGMTGATGAPLGVSLLQALREMSEVEPIWLLSKWAKTTIELETPYSVRDVSALAGLFATTPRTRPRPSPPDRFVLTHDHYPLQHENAGRYSRRLRGRAGGARR